MENRYAELLERLERSERELHALRRHSRMARFLALFSVAGAVTFLAIQPGATQSGGFGLRVKGPLTVVDNANRPILQVGGNSAGRGLVLLDETGKMLCGIGQTAQGRGVAVFDAQQKRVAVIGEGATADGAAAGRGVMVFDPAEKGIGLLGAGRNGTTQGRGLTVNDETGAPVAGFGVWPQRPDRGQIVLTDRAGNPIFAQPALP